MDCMKGLVPGPHFLYVRDELRRLLAHVTDYWLNHVVNIPWTDNVGPAAFSMGDAGYWICF